MAEEWKVIQEAPNYSISNEGRIYSNKTDKILCNQKYYNFYTVEMSWNKLMAKYWKYDWIKELDDGEEAKEIKDKPDYFITSKGRVYSLKRHRWLKPTFNKPYYWHVSLGRGFMRNIHSLVGRHFLPDYKPGLEILHIKEELPYPEVNYITNLRAGTQSQNITDMYAKKRDRYSRAAGVGL